MTDRGLVYTAAFLRALATGMVGVLLGIHLARLGYDPAATGLVVAAGLCGTALAALAATLRADSIGRRRFLVGIAALGGMGGAAFALSSTPVAAAASALVGMLNGMGRDRGASLIIEQAILPAAVADADRTRAFAVYNVLQDLGHAAGSLLAALPLVVRRALGTSEDASFRGGFLVCAFVVLATGVLYLRLSPSVEAIGRDRRVQLSPETRGVLWKISSLFALDGLGGGFLTTALISFFFYQRFGVAEGIVGPLFFAARVLNSLSHLFAAWLAKRIGLVNTMVFTHVPSSLLLCTMALAPDFRTAACLFLLREGLVEMDVPTRQSYVMAVVRPRERTFVSGVTHLVRLAAWAVAPPLAGVLMKGVSLATPLVVGAAMKISYDGLLYLAFRKLRPPEERHPRAR